MHLQKKKKEQKKTKKTHTALIVKKGVWYIVSVWWDVK